MKGLYATPVRVYLCIAALAVAGILAGLKLPVSLFPNSSKPRIGVSIPYGGSTADEFLHTHGTYLEQQLRSISGQDLEVELLEATYNADEANFRLQFRWGAEPRVALREVQSVVNGFGGRLPTEVRDGIEVWSGRDNSGFFAMSFYSRTRGPDELYKIVEPILGPRLARVQDAENPGLWNPLQKEIAVELNPDTLATLHLFPNAVEAAVDRALRGHGGGTLDTGMRKYAVQVPREASTLDQLGSVLIPTGGGGTVHLSDIARIDYGPASNGSQSFRTSGAPSLILFAKPRPGGNVKRMSEELLAVVEEARPSLPVDIEYKVLVDPSEFIRSSVNNVFKEVALGSLLAVLVLFLFIGSFRNVFTAAIEIPLSMVLAFMAMKLSGMNLNLISLGGLALSAGMNVDASVVVMENIFRHFEALSPEQRAKLVYGDRLQLITTAVAEVRFAVIASTIASLVVFLPLAFTSELSYAILGDLAKTVVFSHGLSMFVALILVPTVRLHLMSGGKETPAHSPIEGLIKRVENGYGNALGAFIARPLLKWGGMGALAVALTALAVTVLPRLPTEIIGKPDTDWVVLGVNTQGQSKLRQMETATEEVEARLLEKLGAKVAYTFTQIHGANSSMIMARLKDKKDMRTFSEALESEFTNTPFTTFFVDQWNPSELPIPNPPQMKIVIRGGEPAERARIARDLKEKLEEVEAFPRVYADPSPDIARNVVMRPYLDQWGRNASFTSADIADLVRVATQGRRIGQISPGGADGTQTVSIQMRFPSATVSSLDEVGALPVGVGAKLVPLRALTSVNIEEVAPDVRREDGHEMNGLFGRNKTGEPGSLTAGRMKKAEEVLAKWRATAPAGGPSVTFEDAERDLNEALYQLGTAVALSVALIFITMVIQFGSVVNALLVMVAVPLGFIGVLMALFVFKSTLSLNSVLGVILLNGIAVANSIILVDFLKRLVEQGMAPREAAVEAARKRLRPILITSLTTVLGMLPIALGLGEGGRILQPLGIAVSGGLWVSMGLTLFIVPALQVAWLERGRPRERASNERIFVGVNLVKPGLRFSLARWLPGRAVK